MSNQSINQKQKLITRQIELMTVKIVNLLTIEQNALKKENSNYPHLRRYQIIQKIKSYSMKQRFLHLHTLQYYEM